MKKRGVYKGRVPVQIEKIAAVEQKRAEGLSVLRACKLVGIGRTTYYAKRDEIYEEEEKANERKER